MDTTTRTYALPYIDIATARVEVRRRLSAAALSTVPATQAYFTYGGNPETGGREVRMTITGVSRLHSTLLADYEWTGR